jgi:Golgi phosphoprotein 3
MELPVLTQFVILSLNPDKGRIMIDSIHFKYSLTGAVLMDLLNNAEISLSGNKLVSSIKKTGDPVHDLFAEKIGGSSKSRRISYWVRNLSGKSKLVFRETINSLVNKGIFRHEKRLFLNLFPYHRYFITDRRIRAGIIDEIRDVILHNKQATRKHGMLIGLINASRSHQLLVKEKGERRTLRRKCNDFRQDDPMASEIDKTIKEVQAAIIASITAASVATSGSH